MSHSTNTEAGCCLDTSETVATETSPGKQTRGARVALLLSLSGQRQPGGLAPAD